MLGCKLENTPINPSLDLWDESSELFEDTGRYRRLIGKLIYLTVIQPNVTFAVGLISQFMHKLRVVHWKVSLHILAYLKSAPGRGLLYKCHGHTKVVGYSDLGYAGDRRDIVPL